MKHLPTNFQQNRRSFTCALQKILNSSFKEQGLLLYHGLKEDHEQIDEQTTL